MSHWQTGKMKLNCSLAVLKRALINIMPQWDKHIKVDPSGNLDLQGYGGTVKKGFNLVVPKGSATGISYEDMGFKQESDDSWSVMRGTYLPRTIRDPEGQVLQQVATMKARAIAAVRGYQITKDQKIGDEQVIEMIIPAGDEQQFLMV